MGLLKRFLFKPILRALDEREHKLAQQQAEALARKADAERELSEYAHNNALMEQQRDDFLQQARTEADQEREQLLEAARNDVAVMRADWQRALELEQSSLHQQIMQYTREEVLAITRKTLTDLASMNLEHCICDVFMQRLQVLNEHERKVLKQATQVSSKPLRVQTTFELSPELKCALQQAIAAFFEADVSVEFSTNADLVCGIELGTDGHKLSWNIDAYLTGLESILDRALKAAKTLSPTISAETDDYYANG